MKLGKNSKKNRKGINQKLIEIDDLAIEITCIDYGHGKHSGLRTAEDQNELYKNGLSSCDGYKKLSNHQSGHALDFYAYVNGQASWNPAYLSIIACAYFQAASKLNYKIRWGGFFKPHKKTENIIHGWDMPHIELI